MSCLLRLLLMQSHTLGDEGGPPRLARYLAARKEERERVKSLAEAGAADASLYEPPGSREAVVLRRSSNALQPVVGLREQGLTRAQVRARCRRSSTSSEEGLPIRTAFRRRLSARQEQKRGRGNDSSGRAEEDGAAGAAESVGQVATTFIGEPTGEQGAPSGANGSNVGVQSLEATGANGTGVSLADALAAARAAALAAKKKRIAFVAGQQQPVQPESAPDKVASTTMRQRIQTVKHAWEAFLEGQPEGWLAPGEVPDFNASSFARGDR